MPRKKDNTSIVGDKIKAVPQEPQEVGADVNNEFVNLFIDAAQNNTIDLSSIENFSNVSQTREQIYSLIDTMAQDDRVSAILETYTEDVVETNERGQVVWCESSDDKINDFVNYLLDVLNVDKHSYEWVFSFIKYGDLYLRLFRKSDYEDDEKLFKEDSNSKTLNENKQNNLDAKKELKESINVILHQEGDHYQPYVEMVNNPGEMFELTKHGKTMAYIQAPTNVQSIFNNQEAYNFMYYKMKQKDINIYSATDFVHGCLANNNTSRAPEEVSIFTDDSDYDAEKSTVANTFKVRKGQSLLYNQFRTWRQLSLLENSVLLNRLTKSAIVRLLNIDIGDMSKDQAKIYVDRLKQMIEQKSSIQVGKSIQEYTNPGPIENTVYLPTHNGQGGVTATVLGADNYDPKSLTDLEYFQDKFYGNMRVPKQFFNLTGDSAGFDGGKSLAIISSRYGKEIKQIQNTFIQMLTDLINFFLIDRGYTSYINKFRLRMQAPITQEELDRRENMRNRMGVIQDVMAQVGDVVKDEIIKLKIVKALLSQTITDPEVISLLQEQIDALENKAPKKDDDNKKGDNDSQQSRSRPNENEPPMETPSFGEPREEPELELETPEESPTEGEESYLPSPDELGISLVDNA